MPFLPAPYVSLDGWVTGWLSYFLRASDARPKSRTELTVQLRGHKECHCILGGHVGRITGDKTAVQRAVGLKTKIPARAIFFCFFLREKGIKRCFYFLGKNTGFCTKFGALGIRMNRGLQDRGAIYAVQ